MTKCFTEAYIESFEVGSTGVQICLSPANPFAFMEGQNKFIIFKVDSEKVENADFGNRVVSAFLCPVTKRFYATAELLKGVFKVETILTLKHQHIKSRFFVDAEKLQREGNDEIVAWGEGEMF